jgi:hypothetical protein
VLGAQAVLDAAAGWLLVVGHWKLDLEGESLRAEAAI